MRSAPAYRKQASNSALGIEKGALHTRLEVVFALYFRFLSAFFCSKGANKASAQKNRALRYNPPFAMEAYALRARQRVSIRSALAYRKCTSLRAFSFENGAWHTRLEACVCFDICFFGRIPAARGRAFRSSSCVDNL
jgi:hypothetical protein